MSFATNEHEEKKTEKKRFENRSIYRPLVAIVCIAQKDNEGDKEAKIKDYQNALFAFNAELHCDCIFQHEEKEDIEYINSFKSRKMKPWTDKQITSANYKTSWKKQEIFDFFDKCLVTIKDDKAGMHKYDSLIVVLTAFSTEPTIKTIRPNEKYCQSIEDSNGNKIEMLKIFESVNKEEFEKIFGTKNDDKSAKRSFRNQLPNVFIRFFMIDRYFHVETLNESKELNQLNKEEELQMKKIEIDKKHGVFFQFHSHVRPLATHNASQEGGLLSRAIKKVFSDYPPIQIQKRQFDDELVIEKCRIGHYMLHMACIMNETGKAFVMVDFPSRGSADRKIRVEMEFVTKDWRADETE